MRWMAGVVVGLLAGMGAVAAEAGAPVAAEAWPEAGVPVEVDVHYDYADETGQLWGGRVRLQIERPDWTKVIPAPVWSAWARDGSPANRIDLVLVGDGYTATQMGTYAAHANAAMATFFAEEPFRSYGDYFNIHRIDVVSNESGVSNDPVQGITRDTALQMHYWCGGTERLLCVNTSLALAYANNAPDVDMVLAIANSTKYGGAGYSWLSLATVAGGNGWAADIALHEFGHSLGKLADEYDYGGPATYTGGEPTDRNTSKYNATQMGINGRKWAPWLGTNLAAYDGLVSTYEGAAYSQYGIYRPTNNSKMRALGRPFNLPSCEGLILEMYKIVRPIDDATPTELPLSALDTVYVTPLEPTDHALEVRWYVNDELVAGATEPVLELATLPLTAGVHTLRVVVSDPTWMVRDEAARALWLTEQRTWTIVATELLGDLNCDGARDTADIDAFVLALVDPAGYAAAQPECNRMLADCNGDGVVDTADIDTFVALIVGG
jgi:hypothetical protein